MIRAITGKSSWRTAPATTLEAAAAHIANTNNPHGVTKSQVGLGSVQNYGIASQAQAEAGSANDVYMTPVRVAQYVNTRLQNNIRFRINNGVVEYYDGAGWRNVSNIQVGRPRTASASSSSTSWVTVLNISGVQGRVEYIRASGTSSNQGEIRVTIDGVAETISGNLSLLYLGSFIPSGSAAPAYSEEPIYFNSSCKIEARMVSSGSLTCEVRYRLKAGAT